MSNFIDAEGHFDFVGQKVIGTTQPIVVNGDKAKALWLLLADQKQTDLLFWGPSFCVIGGAEDMQFGLGVGGVTHTLGVWVPAFCDRLAFDIYAKGVGTVTFGSSYSITVDAAGDNPLHYPGSNTQNLLSVTGTTAGNSVFQKIDFQKGAGVDVFCVVVRFLRSSQTIS
jgi:hypothetical protein